MDRQRRTGAQHSASTPSRPPTETILVQPDRRSTNASGTHKRTSSRVETTDLAQHPEYVDPDQSIPTDFGAPRLSRARARASTDSEKRASRPRSQSPSLTPSSPSGTHTRTQLQAQTQVHRTQAHPPSRLSISESATQTAEQADVSAQRSINANTKPKRNTEKSNRIEGETESRAHPLYPMFNDGSVVFTPAYTDFAPAKVVIKALVDANIKYAVGVDAVPTYYAVEDLSVTRVSATGSDKEKLDELARKFTKEVIKMRSSGRVAILCGDKSVCPMFLAYFLISKYNWTVDGALYMILTSWVDACPTATCIKILNELENKEYGKVARNGVKLDVFTFSGVDMLPTASNKRQDLFNPSWITWMKSAHDEVRQGDLNGLGYTSIQSYFNLERHLIGSISDALSPQYIQGHNIVGVIALGAYSRPHSMSDDIEYKRVSIEYDSEDLLDSIKSTGRYLESFESDIKKARMKNGKILICDRRVGSLAVCVYTGVLMQASQGLDGKYNLGLRPAFECACKKNMNPKLSPGPGFIAQLRCYERMIRANVLRSSPFGSSGHRLNQQRRNRTI